MVWYGVVWCGMAWYGVVWGGMGWYGVVWCGLVWFGGLVWYGKSRFARMRPARELRKFRMGRSGLRYACDGIGVGWCGMVYCGVVGYFVVWCGMVWCGTSAVSNQ